MTSPTAIYRQRSKDWKAVFWVGVIALGLGVINAGWRWPFSSTPAPFTPAVVPPTPYVTPAVPAQPAAPAALPTPAAPTAAAAPNKIIQSLPPATIDPQIAPSSIPELEGIERPAPAKKRPPPEFAVQHGYEAPTEPEPENVR